MALFSVKSCIVCGAAQSFVPVALRAIPNLEFYYRSFKTHYLYPNSQQSLFNPILFLSKYVIIRDCIPDPWSERNKKIDTRMYAWMHFILQVAHIIEKGFSQFKRTNIFLYYIHVSTKIWLRLSLAFEKGSSLIQIILEECRYS